MESGDYYLYRFGVPFADARHAAEVFGVKQGHKRCIVVIDLVDVILIENAGRRLVYVSDFIDEMTRIEDSEGTETESHPSKRIQQ